VKPRERAEFVPGSRPAGGRPHQAWRSSRSVVVGPPFGFATGRFTTPEEVATLITFLASGRAGNITGSNYLIDGGLITTT
jgi:NAD(P)-dependent dehydrogenase (short-subunit alcohol dehydrogenase family)